MRAQLIELTPASADALAEGVVVEQALHDRLAIVERALDRDVVDVGVGDRRHLPALHVRDAALGIEDEDVDAGAAAERLDGGAAGIARGGADDGGACAARAQDVVHRGAPATASPRP